MMPSATADLLPSDVVSVSELNAFAKNLLESHLVGFWVAGEVSNLTRAASGHIYFSLKDKYAQVRCTLFKGMASRLSHTLKEGDHIEVQGRIGIYEARGEFQITVQELRLKGLGQLYEAYERLKQMLQAQGVFDANRKKPLPSAPQSIGIVTSLAAAALRDVLSTLKRRSPEIPIVIYPAAVQGVGSAEQIAAAIQTASTRQDVDVLIVCRGGGSIEDLWSFNEEIVVRAIEQCVIPVVSGVGHETDFTLTDFVADLRAPTPTAAAELVSPNRVEQIQRLQQAKLALRLALQQRYQDTAQKVDWLSRQLRHPAQKWQMQARQLAALVQQLRFAMQHYGRQHRTQMMKQVQLLAYLRPNTQEQQQKLWNMQTALQRAWQHKLWQCQQRFSKQEELLQAVSPNHILARGFSVVRNSRGKVIRDAATLKQGQKLHITFADGEIDVRVTAEQAQADLFDFS